MTTRASQPVTCQECGIGFTPRRRGARFCTKQPCYKAFQNRKATRGAILYDFFMSDQYDRTERGTGTESLRATMAALAFKFREEDRRDRDGRPSWEKPSRVLERNPSIRAKSYTVRIGR